MAKKQKTRAELQAEIDQLHFTMEVLEGAKKGALEAGEELRGELERERSRSQEVLSRALRAEKRFEFLDSVTDGIVEWLHWEVEKDLINS
jgi:hypothetical protein